jgi:formate hydrogenlyase subunit 4
MKITAWILPIMAWLLAPLMIGIINRVKALFAGRQGVPLFQLYFDIFKLLRKSSVYSRTTTGVTRITPAIVLGTMLTASAIIPWGTFSAPLSFSGDIILLAYLLGLARFMTVLAALDTGSSFEGMGASREVYFGTLTEPSIFLGMLTLVFLSGQIGISDIFANIDRGIGIFGFAPLLLIAFSWGIALLTENSRIPVDDPNTHLELTMIHEVMILDYSGPDFGYMIYAASLKLWIFSALLVNLLIPYQVINTWFQAPFFLFAMVLVAVAVGVVESVMARLRFQRIPKLLIGSGALGAIALILMVLGRSV